MWRALLDLFGQRTPAKTPADAASESAIDTKEITHQALLGDTGLVFVTRQDEREPAPGGEGDQMGDSTAAIRVLIVDDDPIVRSALANYVRAAPDLDLIGELNDGSEVVAAPKADVVLMDVQMPQRNGIEATRDLLVRDPAVRVLMLTSFDTDSFLIEALNAGASGFLLKATTEEALVEAIRGVHRGNTVMSPASAATLLKQHGSSARPPAHDLELSSRELDILTALCAGASNAEIANELYLAESTVKTHVSNLMLKLGVTSRLKAVVKAHELGLVNR